MKRLIIAVLVPTAIFCVQTALSIPVVSDFVKGWDGRTQLGLASVLVVLFTGSQLGTLIRPFLKLARLEEAKLNILDAHAKALCDKYRAQGIELRANVMLPKRKWVCLLEPLEKDDSRSKVRFCQVCLFPYWVSPNMNHASDRDLVFTINQGGCGRAYREAQPFGVDASITNGGTYNMNQDQIGKTAGVQFVVSFPIRQLDLDSRRLTGKIIGVLNVDSRTHGSARLINDSASFQELTEQVENFSELCSWLL